MKNLMKIAIALGTLITIGGASDTTTGRCPSCPPEEKGVSPEISENRAKKQCEKIKKQMQNATLDNTEDSTTKRAAYLEQLFISPAIYHGQISYYEKHWWPIFKDLAINDPYPKVRARALEYLFDFRSIPKKDRYAVLTESLDDPHAMVKYQAAMQIVSRSTYDSIIPNPRALEIVKDAVLGKDRSKWNVKGFYTKDEFKSNPEVVEKLRDNIQLGAINTIDLYRKTKTHGNGNVTEYLNEIIETSPTEETRFSARRALELIRQHAE